VEGSCVRHRESLLSLPSLNRVTRCAVALGAVLSAVSLVVGPSWWGGAAGATVPVPVPRYLALGGSSSVGVQPTLGDPSGRPTGKGYADDLAVRARQEWPGLRLTTFGCPGATTGTMLFGGGRCHYAGGSQLSAADHFLRTHPTVRLLTIDVGFNDIRPCMVDQSVNLPCVSRGLDLVDQQLPSILASVKEAADHQVEIIGVGHYDPFVEASRHGPEGDGFAAETVSTVERLNRTLLAIYRRFGVPMADVSTAFDMTSTRAVDVHGTTEPENAARVCALTWMCAPHPYGPNLHPNDAGYQVIAETLARLLPAG
jgi:lysophospholipase L1-like esterase